ncbi:hypothetical protein ACMFMF_009884 [Clarireedia jacksonii]
MMAKYMFCVFSKALGRCWAARCSVLSNRNSSRTTKWNPNNHPAESGKLCSVVNILIWQSGAEQVRRDGETIKPYNVKENKTRRASSGATKSQVAKCVCSFVRYCPS